MIRRIETIAGAGISPVGYYRLGSSAPRNRVRQYLVRRRITAGVGQVGGGTLVGRWVDVTTATIESRSIAARIDGETLEAEIER